MSHLRPRFRAFYRCAAFLALLAMFVPVLTGLVHHPVAAAQSMGMSAMNMSTMMMAGQPCPMEQGKQSDNGKSHKAPSCPICQSLHMLAGGYVPPAPLVLADAAPQADAPVVTSSVIRVAFAATPQGRPRAPPFSA